MKQLTEKKDRKLFSAVEEGNINEIEKCLDEGADVLARNVHHTILHSAVLSDDEEVVKLILDKIEETQGSVRPYINATDTEGDTPLNWSAESGYVNSARMLLNYGADVEAKNNNDMRAIHCAAKNNHLEITKLLIENGAKVNVKDSTGHTPLNYAEEKGNYEIAGLLAFSVAEMFRQEKIYEKAKQAFQKAISIQERVLGPEHVDTLMSYHNMALVLVDQGEYQEALNIYQKIFDIQKREDVLGPNHPQTLKTRYNMAVAFGAQGNNYEVSRIFYEILDIIGSKLSPEDQQTLMARKGKEEASDNQGLHDFSEDLRIFRRVLSFKETKQDSDHISNLRSSNVKTIESENLDTASNLSEDGGKEVATDLDIVTESKMINDVDILDDATETRVKQPFNSKLSNSKERQEKQELVDECILSKRDVLKAIKKRVAEHLDLRFHDMYLVRGKYRGERAFKYVLVDPLKRKAFKEKTKKDDGSIDVDYYGKVLKFGWCENPPQDLKDKFDSFTKKMSNDLFVTMEEYGKTNIYYYVLIDSEKRDMLQRKSKKYLSLSDIKQNCEGVLYSGWGQDPPETISDKIINTYMCTSEWMLEENFPNPSDKECETIHDAARNCELEKLRDLIARKVDVNSIDQNGWTPLHHAAYVGNLEVVKHLTDGGASINVKDKVCCKMPLHIAAREGHTDIIELFLNRRRFLMKIVTINDVDEVKWTPLHYAAWSGNLNTVQFLVNKGADIQAKEAFHGKKPLHISAERGYLNILQWFLRSGNSVDDTDSEGRTSLYYAAWKGHLEVVKYLLDNNANINAENIYGSKPIHAARCGGKNVIEFLLHRGANVNDTTKDNYTPLHLAAFDGQLEVVKFLVKKGANITATDDKGNTPLHYAKEKEHKHVIDFLDSVMKNPSRTSLHDS